MICLCGKIKALLKEWGARAADLYKSEGEGLLTFKQMRGNTTVK